VLAWLDSVEIKQLWIDSSLPHDLGPIARLENQYLSGFPKASRSSLRREHYQLSGEIALWSTANALKIRQTFELHCEGKPFEVNTPIIIESGIISARVNEAKQDILQFTQKGRVRT